MSDTEVRLVNVGLPFQGGANALVDLAPSIEIDLSATSYSM